MEYILVGAILIIVTICTVVGIATSIYKKLENEVMKELELSSWDAIRYYDKHITVKSRQALNNYTVVKFLKEEKWRLERAEIILNSKQRKAQTLKSFLKNNAYKSRVMYSRVDAKIRELISNAKAYRICVTYISSAGNNLGERTFRIEQQDIDKFKNNPSLLMNKGEYNQYIKGQQKVALSTKQHEYYEQVNKIIDSANENRDRLVIKGSTDQLDDLVAQLFDRTVNSIKKVKTVNSEEWLVIGGLINRIGGAIDNIINQNKKILDYYESPDFLKIKITCETLMSSQREFNEYINEKVKSISDLFGVRVVRNETANEDEYEYVRPYKKSVSPFIAEVSSSVFSSAENNPLEYIVKNFYPDKALYPEQIQKLHVLIEELETLKEAKRIIEVHKAEYQQYLGDVPDYVMEGDPNGFYSKLGFANIDESVLAVEYKFSYTSNGGKAKRTFPVPMTEDTIIELIKMLENKLTLKSFTKEQRSLMTVKLREFIKSRDKYTCCICGNSTDKEPNLLLEIDHILPVSKGGHTTEENLQTLCWKCNRAKSNKI